MGKGVDVAQTDPWFGSDAPCPECRAPGLRRAADRLHCGGCGTDFELRDGIWRCLAAARLDALAPFLDSYRRVRAAEGRGRYDPETLRHLPACAQSHEHARQWAIRAASFARLVRLLTARVGGDARVLDLGAGNGWLCHRLQQIGYRGCAVDLRIDAEDGLGAASAFGPPWPRLQAAFECLPLASGCADVVVFNASFHYSIDPEATLGEGMRVLRPGGLLVILDTPVYADASSGERMLEEQQAYIENIIGERSDALACAGYLTWARLDELAAVLGLAWHVDKPWYGLRWALRPLLARLRGLREPATFALVWTTRP